MTVSDALFRDAVSLGEDAIKMVETLTLVPATDNPAVLVEVDRLCCEGLSLLDTVALVLPSHQAAQLRELVSEIEAVEVTDEHRG